MLGATASNYAGVLASNAVSGAAQAWIDNSGADVDESIEAGGSVSVRASDSAVIIASTDLGGADLVVQ
ncbi:MAG: hypothetical protein M5U09_14650 [Gammaproteobacteria bacterium]|nr:hypothetical protein [Gammaproteobacteria bacterium]